MRALLDVPGHSMQRHPIPRVLFVAMSRLRALARSRSHLLVLAASLLALVLSANASVVTASAQGNTGGVWPTYLAGNTRSGFDSSETVVTPATVARLKLHWRVASAGAISTQVVAANGMLYWGSWDGYERATTLSGAVVWKTYLGQTTGTICAKTAHGISSTATVTTINGSPAVLVGGGNGNMYALNANTGKVLWQTAIAKPTAEYLWSSPAVNNGSVYIGVSSLSDCPLIPGRLVRLNAATGTVLNTFMTVPMGCRGASIWGSPAVDPTTGNVYFATGNGGACKSAEPYAEAVVAVNGSTLAPLSSWVPAHPKVGDLDFGSTPTLFTATVRGVQHAMLGLVNKNGLFYALDRSALSRGPLWSAHVSVSGANPAKGLGSIAPAAWDGAHLYVAGGKTTVKGVSCAGSVGALNPSTGAYVWQACLSAPVLAAVSAVPGVVFVGDGSSMFALFASSGAILFRFHDASNGVFWGAPSISAGILYEGNADRSVFALGM